MGDFFAFDKMKEETGSVFEKVGLKDSAEEEGACTFPEGLRESAEEMEEETRGVLGDLKVDQSVEEEAEEEESKRDPEVSEDCGVMTDFARDEPFGKATQLLISEGGT